MRRRGKVGLHHQRGQASTADREIRKCADYDGRGFSGNAGEGTEEVITPQDHVPVYSRLVKRRSKGVQKLLKPHKYGVYKCVVWIVTQTKYSGLPTVWNTPVGSGRTSKKVRKRKDRTADRRYRADA